MLHVGISWIDSGFWMMNFNSTKRTWHNIWWFWWRQNLVIAEWYYMVPFCSKSYLFWFDFKDLYMFLLRSITFFSLFLLIKGGVLFNYIYKRVYTTTDSSSLKGHNLLVPKFSISHTEGTYIKAGQVS